MSRSEQKANERAEFKAKTTEIKTDFNGISLDTTIEETVVFINSVDDEEGMAYGHIYQFEGAKVTCINVAAPYECIVYDDTNEMHKLNTKAFINALNDEHPKANMFVKTTGLVGYAYKEGENEVIN